MSDKREINIIHLYPDLLNLYGDKGNIACLKTRLSERGIGANVIEVTSKSDDFDIESADIIFLGGGSDREQEIVCGLLKEKAEQLKAYIENDGVLLATCGGFQMLGNYYMTSGGKVDGLGVLDISAEYNEKRLIGNVVLESGWVSQKIVGFENHPTRTDIGGYAPLGKVVVGCGNTDDDGYEGLIYNNTIATNLHGPLLPKNPMVCDYLLNAALKKKYPDFTELDALDDTLENAANEQIVKRFVVKK